MKAGMTFSGAHGCVCILLGRISSLESARADRLYLLQVMSKQLLFLIAKFWTLQCRKIKCIEDFSHLFKKYPKINLIFIELLNFTTVWDNQETCS